VSAAAADPNFNAVRKDGAVAKFWTAYCGLAGLPTATPCQTWYFGDTPALAHELVELVLRGPKRATAGLAWFNDEHPDVSPVPHGYSVITEFDGSPRAVVRTAQLDRLPFHAVDASFACDEGEGDRTLADWRDGHQRYFTRWMESIGRRFNEDMEVDLERFELLYPFDLALNPVDCGPRIVPGYLPGAFGTLLALHGSYYTAYGFGSPFEASLAREMGAFAARFDPGRDGLWVAVDRGAIHGAIAIDGSEAPGLGHLRWFLLDDSLRGKGLGQRMLDRALRFCRDAGERRVYLTTFAELLPAAHLYRSRGFRLVGERDTCHWGRKMREQRHELELG
jgi:uncharacterized protein YhfF/GNAT superfamily N-acetyltransferase